MFGFKYVKTQPTTYLLVYRNGKLIAEGAGLSRFCYAPATTLVSVPIASREEPFIFEKVTADFQSVTVQGHVSFRIAEPKKTASLLNFALLPNASGYAAKDPEKLAERVLAITQVLIQQVIQQAALADAIRRSSEFAKRVLDGLKAHPEVTALGVEVLGLAVLAVKPTPDTARALEATAREEILRSADEAIYARRNAAVENERAIKQNELDTEIAIEQKKRAIRETQMEVEASVRRKKNELRQAEMEADIAIEKRRREFVDTNADNIRVLADAEAHRIAAAVKALQAVDPRIVQALAASSMQPGQLIAQAFGGLAERAEKIGQLNVSPDLLQGLLAAAAPAATTPALKERNRGELRP
jgi:hypothetical protein